MNDTKSEILTIVFIFVFFIEFAIMPSLAIVLFIEGEPLKALSAACVFLGGVIGEICFLVRQRKKLADLMAAILAEKRAAGNKPSGDEMKDYITEGERS